MNPYYDREGNPISGELHKRLSADRAYVRIGATELVSEAEPPVRFVVSTVWTGINTGGREIFESLVSRNGVDEEDPQRYHTEEQAVTGHNALVGKCMLELGPGSKLVREIPAEET